MALKEDLLSTFNAMPDSKEFDEIAQNIADYMDNASITMKTSGGTHGSNTVAMISGSGSFDTSSGVSAFKKLIKTATDAMKNMTKGGDSYLASQLVTGISALVASGTVSVTCNGTETVPPPSGATSKVSWEEEGKITCTGAEKLLTDIQDVFDEMGKKVDDESKTKKDDYLADGLASAIHTYFTAGVVATTGKNGYTTTGVGTVSATK